MAMQYGADWHQGVVMTVSGTHKRTGERRRCVLVSSAVELLGEGGFEFEAV